MQEVYIVNRIAGVVAPELQYVFEDKDTALQFIKTRYEPSYFQLETVILIPKVENIYSI